MADTGWQVDFLLGILVTHSGYNIWVLFQNKCFHTSVGNLSVEIRWSKDCLISTMGFPILVAHTDIERGPWFHQATYCFSWLTINLDNKEIIKILHSWWRHQAKKISSLLALCEGNPLVNGGFPSQRPVTRSFDVFFDMHLNKGLSKQARHRWYKTPSCSLWGQRYVLCTVTKLSQGIFSWWNFDNQTQDDRPPSPMVPGGNLRRSWGNTDWHGPLIPSLFQL